jgi:hypothetical protein
MRHQLSHVIGIALLLVLLIACATPVATPTTMPDTATLVPPTPTPKLPFRVLFIGNSFTFYNTGLDYHMNQLVGSSNPPLNIEAESVVRPGATLESLWKVPHVREAINEGNYDVVVLQGDIPETDVETFHEYARRFVAEIKKVGAEPILFMAWSYERLGWITMEEIAQAHIDIAMELDVDVAPVGLVWQQAMKERPELDMYDSDAEHPSIYGTYLAVNVVYATVFGESPARLTYLPPEGFYTLSNGGYTVDITEEAAAFLQRIAWETVQEYQAQQ